MRSNTHVSDSVIEVEGGNGEDLQWDIIQNGAGTIWQVIFVGC